MAYINTLKSFKLIIEMIVVNYNSWIKYNLIDAQELLPSSVDGHFSWYSHGVPLRGFPYQCFHLFWCSEPECTGLSLVVAMVSGNVNWYPIGQPAAGRLVLFEKPKGQLGGVSCRPNKSRGPICFDATRKCPGNVSASIRTTLAVRNIVFINHYARAQPLKLDYGSSCRWRWVHFTFPTW